MARLSICLACFVVFFGSVSSAVAGPLGNAAKAGDIAEIERLLNEGADVNESGLATPLFYAIQYNHTDAARLLIERGADVDKASTWGTPIHEAAPLAFSNGTIPSSGSLSFSSTSAALLTVLSRASSRNANMTPANSARKKARLIIRFLFGLAGMVGITADEMIRACAVSRSPVTLVSLMRL